MYKKVKNELCKKTKNDLQKYQFIGAEIKSSRLKLSKTLESISNVSKSISYISKVENNKIIPNKECLMELCDELFIKQNDLDSMNNFDDALLEAIKALYLNDKVKIVELYNKYCNFTNVRTQLLLGIYYLSNKDFSNLNNVVEILSKVESSLIIEDYLIYVLLTIECLLEEKEVLQVYKIVKVVKQSENAKNDLKKIFDKIEFDILLSFGLSNCTLEYNKIVDMHLNSQNFEELKRISNENISKKIELGSTEYIVNVINSTVSDEIKFYGMCKIDLLDEAKNLFCKVNNNKYKLYYFYKLNDLESIKELIVKQNLSEEELIFSNYYKLKINKDYDNLRDYLNNVCIPYFIKTCKINILIDLFEDLESINSNNSKYKESCSVATKITNLLKKIFSELT